MSLRTLDVVVHAASGEVHFQATHAESISPDQHGVRFCQADENCEINVDIG
jgi:hypothetical protein